MVAWDTLGAEDLYERLEGSGFLCATGYPCSFSEEGWLGVAGSQTRRIVE